MSTKSITGELTRVWNNNDLVKAAKVVGKIGENVWKGAAAEMRKKYAIKLPKGALLGFYEHGGIRSVDLSEAEVTIPAGTRVEFHEDGTLKATGEVD